MLPGPHSLYLQLTYSVPKDGTKELGFEGSRYQERSWELSSELAALPQIDHQGLCLTGLIDGLIPLSPGSRPGAKADTIERLGTEAWALCSLGDNGVTSSFLQ